MDSNFSRSNIQPHKNAESSRQLFTELAESSNWTVAIDLSTNLRGMDGKQNGAGAQDKWKQLKQLAEQTGAKPVKFVVSVASPESTIQSMPIGSMKRPEAAESRHKVNDSLNSPAEHRDRTDSSGKAAANATIIETYVIEDGSVKQIGRNASSGAAGDVERLLQVASSQAPSKHLGLVIFAHGTRTDAQGIAGDAGADTLSTLQNSIRDGLGTRDKLDLLVFDGCRMATTETANKMQSVADNLVASADQEIALLDKGTDGISLNAPMRDLLQRPDSSGKELSMDFIEEARKGANGTPTKTIWDDEHLRSSVDTLIALDLSKYPAFEQSLNDFASVLDSALSDKSNENAIAEAVDATPSFPSRDPYYRNFQRDIQEFARHILEQIQQGKLIDNGAIKQSAKAILADKQAMTLGYYGSSPYYSKLGGLSLELVVASPSSKEALARAISIPGDLLYLSRDLGNFEASAQMKAAVAQRMNLLNLFQAPEKQADLADLNKAASSLLSSKTAAQYDSAISRLKGSASKFLNAPPGQEMVKSILRGHDYRASDVSGKSWAILVDELSNYEKIHANPVWEPSH